MNRRRFIGHTGLITGALLLPQWTSAAAALAAKDPISAATKKQLADAALNAASLRPDLHVVCRVFDLELARQIRDGLALGSSFSSAQISAPAFIRAALGYEGPQVLRLPLPGAAGHPTPWVLLTQLLAVAGDQYAGRTVGEVAAAAGGAAVLYLPHNDPTCLQFAPASDTAIHPGDALLLAISGGDAPGQPGYGVPAGAS